MQASIFAPTTLGSIQLRNRIIRAATDESMGDAESRKRLCYLYADGVLQDLPPACQNRPQCSDGQVRQRRRLNEIGTI